jgi:8-amino-7-oxononanoate synthase
MTVVPADMVAADLFWKVRADPRARDLQLARRTGVFPYFAPVASPLDREVVVDGRLRLMFGSNNYLGLANDERVRAAAKAAIDRYGTGCTGSRLLNGTLDLHAELEAELADWLAQPAALVFTTGYLANLAAVSTLCGPGDVVVSDARNHASLWDGARLSGADVVSTRHGDVEHLRRRLAVLAADRRPTLVVWDAVFSMEGEVAPVADVVAAARVHGARTLIDEAHSLGVLGPDGAGLAAGLDDPPDLVMATFSKSLASCGGVVAGPADVVDHLRVNARPFLFTAAGVPASVAAALAAARIARAEPWRRERAIEVAGMLAAGLRAIGLDVAWHGSAIVAVGWGDEWRALAAWRALLDHGVYVNVALHPSVPQGSAILRVSATPHHRDADVERCLGAFEHAIAAAGPGAGSEPS